MFAIAIFNYMSLSNRFETHFSNGAEKKEENNEVNS